MMDQQFKFDGAVGGFLPTPFEPNSDNTDIEVEWERVIYDNVFNLLVAILLIEILSGIIIDKFSELREKDEEIEKDCKSGILTQESLIIY
jgi:hypothetical protein